MTSKEFWKDVLFYFVVIIFAAVTFMCWLGFIAGLYWLVEENIRWWFPVSIIVGAACTGILIAASDKSKEELMSIFKYNKSNEGE